MNKVNNIFQLTIELGNSNMQLPQDVAWALRQLANSLDEREPKRDWSLNYKIWDLNGNPVGYAEK